MSASPVFSLLGVRNVGHDDPKIVASISFVVVLPCVPVTAMKVVRESARRHPTATQ